jgi:hypothetical protein
MRGPSDRGRGVQLLEACARCLHPRIQHQLLVRVTAGGGFKTIRGRCRGGGAPENYDDCPKRCRTFLPRQTTLPGSDRTQ